MKSNLEKRKNNLPLLALDPSINYLGLCVFHNYKIEFCCLLKPEFKDANEFDKSLSLFHQIGRLRKEYGTNSTVLEVPEYWAHGGFYARESGSIEKLSIIVGMIYTFGDVTTVVPSKWKKQMTKPVVRNRLMPKYPTAITDKLDHNIVDSIGIGHWYLYGTV